MLDKMLVVKMSSIIATNQIGIRFPKLANDSFVQ